MEIPTAINANNSARTRFWDCVNASRIGHIDGPETGYYLWDSVAWLNTAYVSREGVVAFTYFCLLYECYIPRLYIYVDTLKCAFVCHLCPNVYITGDVIIIGYINTLLYYYIQVFYVTLQLLMRYTRAPTQNSWCKSGGFDVKAADFRCLDSFQVLSLSENLNHK